jgi:hypothetical protein
MTFVLALVVATPAQAEPVEVTAQAKAATATFLRPLVPSGGIATICMVDTGVNETPDTTAVIGRLALSGDAHDRSPSLHGTQIAAFMGAALNGYGMVGLWPASRIVSVRANVDDQDAFTPTGYILGMRRCDEASDVYHPKVVLLSFSSGGQLNDEESQALKAEIDAARANDVNVVVAAGNNGGALPGVPANQPGVLSVGAISSTADTLCPFSAAGSDLAAPGCGLDGADPRTGTPTVSQQGTSFSAALAAVSLSALRSWRPDLTAVGAERLLLDTARAAVPGPVLDVSAAFDAAGLAALLPATTPDQGPPSPSTTPTPTISPTVSPPHVDPPARTRRLPRPRLSAEPRRRNGKIELTLRARNRPPGIHLKIRVLARGTDRKQHTVVTTSTSSSTIRLRIRSWSSVSATFVDPVGRRLTSRTIIVKARR